MTTQPNTRPVTHIEGAPSFVALKNVTKRFGTGPTAVDALHDLDLEIARGQFVVLLGPSGSGKTTLLNIVGGIERPTTGEVRIAGEDIAGLGPDGLTTYRRRHVAFVFQFFNLVPTLTAFENVLLIADLRGGDAEQRSRDALTRVGLPDKMNRFPSELSGGEQQRVAIARALAKDTDLLLCDEPTGALDLERGRTVLSLLREANRDSNKTVLLVTHNSAIARMADRVLNLRSGEMTEDMTVDNPIRAEEVEW